MGFRNKEIIEINQVSIGDGILVRPVLTEGEPGCARRVK
jgi:hypothetical protein